MVAVGRIEAAGGEPEVVVAMSDEATYGGDCDGPPGMRQTHVSWLFFTDRHVFKVKKPVDLGFLDFTARDARRRTCHEETRLNRRLSPGVYLGVVRVVRGDSGYVLESDELQAADSEDRVVDWAVKMRRLPEHLWLSAMLQRGAADRHLMHRIAHRLVSFWMGAERGEDITRMGSLATVRAHVLENFAQVKPSVGAALTAFEYDRVAAYSEAFMQVRESAFRAREREGRVRDGHGDLHCAQICVENGIDFIDCIEFDPAYRCADFAAEIAFTAMDLDFNGRSDLGDALVLEAMARSGDTGLLAMLPFYKCYRAFTRGKVEWLRAQQQRGKAAAATEQTARKYFALAARYARPRRPLLLCLAGLSGTGKSTLASSLAERLDAVVIASDVERKRLAGLEPEQPVHESWGQGIYDASSSRQTYAYLRAEAMRLLAQGRNVVLDASFLKRAERTAARQTASYAGADWLLVVTVLDAECQRRRLTQRQQEGGSPSDGRLAIADAQRRAFEPPDEVGDAERIAVNTGDEPAQVAAATLLQVYRRLLAVGH